ncbi:PREDICTED: protein phosphatase 2C 32-like isoform X1 [Lupinus angustifolius]|uniref:protein phosphatase 2C 32-like isoform X1 n=2 Tax=Lupinus angustifolius TaxID=3871 RepID=UPI00092F191C|nr:PREDICTED: protein phosphatase 2C 32-like isoform X1 [Lupinus angustifolius]XP_019427574.1 PREDICTED: protein phosphatase 2C 32-like isoform X1 [Lupinus angustifolius]
MGNGTSRVVGCLVPFNGKGVDLEFLEPLDEGLGHSFCYVRPSIFESPAITPSNSERYTLDSSTLDSETLSGSFRHDSMEDSSGIHKPSKNFPETTFKTISGASVSANVSTARTGNQSALFASDALEPAASFEGTASFAAIPLQPVPRGSGPLNGFMSGPLERAYASGPLDRGGGFMSGPIEKGVMSGPLDDNDKSNFSAPLAHGRRRPRLQHLMRSVSGPMKNTFSRTFSKNSTSGSWMQRLLFHPVTQLAWHSREAKCRSEVARNCGEVGPSEVEYKHTHNLQWAQGKAGEDRVHVVLSEEQGWLFIGIYDGFSGPDAPDFLMSHLYRFIDMELEGLLWDYEDNPVDPHPLEPEVPKTVKSMAAPVSNRGELCDVHANSNQGSLGSSSGPVIIQDQSSNREIVEDNAENKLPNCGSSTIPCTAPASVPFGQLSGKGRKSVRLYELLQMESWDEQGLFPASEQGKDSSVPRESTLEGHMRPCSSNLKEEISRNWDEDPTTSGKDGSIGFDATKQEQIAAFSVSAQRQNSRKSFINTKLRQMYRKPKSLCKKLFPWSYDWHREEAFVDEKLVEASGPIRRCKSGIDHNAVLRAMERALERAEEAYMKMVENNLDKNPELALMGSCVLVMLMKDQDVYVMNLGDSCVILAQERPNDRHPNPSSVKDEKRHKNRSRESLVRMELDRISEESPIHNQNSDVNKMNKNREISICRLKMRAVQVSIDHSTNTEEEVFRIRTEHPDDNQAIFNGRVKGQLKVTRAFGAGFLKRPSFNEALLEMFQVDYVGTAPYLSCTPSVLHHRLSSSDQFLVLSSDGLYQYFSNEEVVAHVTWFMENVPEGDPAQYLIAELLFRAAKKNGMDFHELLDIPNGDRRKYHDDVSVMVVSLEGRIWKSSG